MGKSTISMAIFNCYVSSPEGIPIINCFLLWFWQEMRRLPTAITSQFHCRWPSAVLQSVAEEQQRIQQAEEQQGWVNRANGSKDYQSWSRYSIYIFNIYIYRWMDHFVTVLWTFLKNHLQHDVKSIHCSIMDHGSYWSSIHKIHQLFFSFTHSWKYIHENTLIVIHKHDTSWFIHYPLVNCHIAIENGHRNSGFTHQK